MRSRLGWAAIVAATACAGPPPSPQSPAPQPIAGVWEGALTSGEDTHAFRLTLESDSAGLHGFMDLPDQYAYRYSVRNLSVDGAEVSFEFPEALPPAKFSGTFDGGRIYGTIKGSDADTAGGTLELARWSGEAVPYRSQQVRFASGDVPLRGTLLVPNSRGPHPAVILLHGSGPQTRESYIRYFADQFARNGIAALIYDKRNTGRTDIPLSQQGMGTFAELADDAAAAVRYLRARPDAVDPRRIGLWGLSQGAWIAPLAAEKIEGIAFLILVSGGGVTPALQEMYDDEVKLRAAGYSTAEIASAMSLLKLANAYTRSQSDSDWQRFQRELAKARDKRWFSELDPSPITLPRESPAWKDPDLDYNPVPLLERLRVPVLVVLGEKDELTPVEQTARLTSRALRKAGNTDYVIREIPGANHGLLVSRAAGESWLEQRPASGWIDGMIAWVKARALRP
jgi:dienelactone hydrolase